MKLTVLATGLSGLVGTRVQELLFPTIEFIDISLTTGIDITDKSQVEDIFKNSTAPVVLHMAAKTDVDSCEDDKILIEGGSAWLVNVVGTENIAQLAEKYGKRVVYISTDFIFDGTKDYYFEDDSPNPVNWYGVTKYEGEKIIRNYDENSTIIRISYPYRSIFPAKPDFVQRILQGIKKGQQVFGLTDHIFTPTFIDDIAIVLQLFLTHHLPGIYHVVGSSSLTTFEATKTIAKIFKLKTKIIPVIRSEYFKSRAFRPFKLALRNDKIKNLGIEMKEFKEGLKEIKKQLSD